MLMLDRTRTAVLVIDMQRAFHTHVPGFFELADQVALLVRGAATLGVPIACSQQYPAGLGPTVASIVDALPEDAATFDKLEFSACEAEAWASLPAAVRDAEQFVLVGIEAHVCVRQTALALLAQGRDVHVAVDAVGSRSALHRDVSLRELSRAGARETTVEQVLFDWLRRAGTQEFKDVQRLIVADA
jgi:nicotinamidase-related amidase